MLLANKSLSLIIVLSIGLGIGLNSTIFSMLNLLLLRPLPGAQHSKELVEVYTSYVGGMQFGSVSYPDFKDWRERNKVFSGLLAQCLTPANLNRNRENQVISAAVVSGNYFSTLEVKPYLGRTFEAQEDEDISGSHPEAVISYGLWQRYFGGDPGVVGGTITVDAHDFTLVGVAPKGFSGANIGLKIDLWAPLSMQSVFLPGSDRLKVRGMRFLQVIGRLKSSISTEKANSMLRPLGAELIREFPGTNRGTSLHLVPLGQGPLGLQNLLLPVVALLMLVVLLILILACFNVANLLLSRAVSRQGEIAVRLALGASRWDIIRLMLTESVVLSMLAGVVALLLAHQTTTLINLFEPPTPVPVFLGLVLDIRVVLFTLGLSLVAGMLFGILPALQATGLNLVAKLRNEGYFQSYRRSKLRDSLVIVQIAISMLLLVGAGLVWRSLQVVHGTNPGFNVDNLVMASVDMGMAGYDSATGVESYRQLLARLQSMPGVRDVSATQNAPMDIGGDQQQGVFIQDNEAISGQNFVIDFNIVAPGYFRTMEMPLMQGREFTDADGTGSMRVAIVNEAFVARFWPGQDPLSKRISISGRGGPFLQIVGVAKDAKYYSIIEKPFPFLYLPLYQNYQPGMVLQVRTAGDPTSSIPILQHTVRAFDLNLPIARVHIMREQIETSLIVLRAAVLFMGVFGLLALVLGCVGLYGVMAYSVAKRKSEIAVRMAVGAQRSNIMALILREGMKLTMIGVVLGTGGALASGRLLSSFLYGIRATDPLTIVSVSLLLACVALVANFVPAWAATKTSPIETLKS